MNQIVFYRSKKYSALLLLISLLFIAGSTYILFSETPFSRQWYFAIIATLFSASAFIVIPYKTFIKPTPLLVLNEHGILANGCPFIGWDNIQGIQLKRVKRSKFLCIFPIEARLLVNQEKLSFFKKLVFTTNQATLGTAVFITLDGFPLPADKLIALIEDYKRKYLACFSHNLQNG